MDKRFGRRKLGRQEKAVVLWLCFLLAAGFALGPTGCTRHFFRERADKEVSAVLAEKDKYPDWAIEQFHVYSDPHARFADPTNPDRPPMPPDDPAAYDLSPNPQKPGHAGIARVEGTGYLDLIAQWDRENREKLAQREAEERKENAPPAGDQKGGAEAASASASYCRPARSCCSAFPTRRSSTSSTRRRPSAPRR